MEDSPIRNLLDKFEKFKEKNKGTFDDQFGNDLLELQAIMFHSSLMYP